MDVLQYLPNADAAAAIDNLARLCHGAMYFNLLTREDWEENCDRQRTNGEVYLRSSACTGGGCGGTSARRAEVCSSARALLSFCGSSRSSHSSNGASARAVCSGSAPPRSAASGLASHAMTRSRQSAGILLFRRTGGSVEVFLVHPGGPYFARKDAGAWSLPKGEVEGDEEPLDVAVREFAEETGQTLELCAPGVRPRSLGSVRQPGGKLVAAWAVEGDWPRGAELVSNEFEIEWPPRSGRRRSYPEVDRGGFFPLDAAREKLNAAQAELLDRLLSDLEAAEAPDGPR